MTSNCNNRKVGKNGKGNSDSRYDQKKGSMSFVIVSIIAIAAFYY